MSKPAIRILPVTLPDSSNPTSLTELETVSAIETAAFQIGRSKEDTALHRLMFGSPSAVSRSQRADELRMKLRNEPAPRIYKAILAGDPIFGQEEAEATIVGFATWNFYDPKHPLPTLLEKGDNKAPPSHHPRIFNDFFGALEGKRELFMGKGRFAHLEMLAVLPSYQGLGIGTELLSVGLQEADRREIPAWVEATPEAFPLYRSHGFCQVVEVSIGLREYGADGVVQTYCMLRPKSKRRD